MRGCGSPRNLSCLKLQGFCAGWGSRAIPPCRAPVAEAAPVLPGTQLGHSWGAQNPRFQSRHLPRAPALLTGSSSSGPDTKPFLSAGIHGNTKQHSFPRPSVRTFSYTSFHAFSKAVLISCTMEYWLSILEYPPGGTHQHRKSQL